MMKLFAFLLTLLFGPLVSWLWIPIGDTIIWFLVSTGLAILTGGVSVVITIPALAIYTAQRA